MVTLISSLGSSKKKKRGSKTKRRSKETSMSPEARSPEARFSGARSSEARSSEARSSEARSSVGRTSEGRTSEGRTSEGRTSEVDAANGIVGSVREEEIPAAAGKTEERERKGREGGGKYCYTTAGKRVLYRVLINLMSVLYICIHISTQQCM